MIATPTIHLLSESTNRMREQLSMVIHNTGWEVARHTSAEEFLRRFRLERHGCLLVAPGQHGPMPAMEMIRGLRERWLNLPILLAADSGEPHSLEVAAVHSGAFDVIRCPASDETLRNQIARALEYDRQGSGLPSLVRTRLASLSPKEREVLDLTLAGQSTNAMASQLEVCYQTINKHRARIRLKMRAKCDMVLANSLRGEAPLPHECGYLESPAAETPGTRAGAPAAPHTSLGNGVSSGVS